MNTLDHRPDELELSKLLAERNARMENLPWKTGDGYTKNPDIEIIREALTEKVRDWGDPSDKCWNAMNALSKLELDIAEKRNRVLEEAALKVSVRENAFRSGALLQLNPRETREFHRQIADVLNDAIYAIRSLKVWHI